MAGGGRAVLMSLIFFALVSLACASVHQRGYAGPRPRYPDHDEEEDQHPSYYEHRGPHEPPPYEYNGEHQPHHEDEQARIALELQEVSIEGYTNTTQPASISYKSKFLCGGNKKDAADCAAGDPRGIAGFDFLENALMQEYAGECTWTLTDADPGRTSPLCSVAPCWRVDVSCTILNARQCGCALPPGFTFNATGRVNTFRALSCSQSYNPPGFTGSRSAARQGAGQAAQQAASAAYGGRAANGTAYLGTAVALEAEVTKCSAPWGSDGGVVGELHRGKLLYTASFLNGTGLPVTSDSYGDVLVAHAPFITPGSLKVILKEW